MKQFCTIIFLTIALSVQGQNAIEWDGEYQLQLSDFQSPETQIGQGNIYFISLSSSFDFAFHMSGFEFMLTKNFNSKVNCSFKREEASIVAPDTLMALDLLAFARYEFDLSELYARKFRKKIFEKKKAFSDASFYSPLYDEIRKEYVAARTAAAKSADLGRNREILNELHGEVLKEIQQLADFCKMCNPKKKKNG
jgi:hypothetical protein